MLLVTQRIFYRLTFRSGRFKSFVFCLIAPIICVLLLTTQWVQGQTDICTYYQQGATEDYFLYFPADRHISGTVSTYSSGCETANSSVSTDSQGWAYAGTEAEALLVCGSNEAFRVANHADYTKATPNQNIWWCSTRAAGRSRSRSFSQVPVPTPTPTPIPTPTGYTLMENTALEVSAVDGLSSGIQFQRVDAAGVGIQWVIDLGLIDAVDVWSNIGQGYEVCFPQEGAIIFLDAATAPRTVTSVEWFSRAGYSCAALDRAGTLVLVPSTGGVIAPAPVSQAALQSCTVTTTHNVNLRNAPSGDASSTIVPLGTTLASGARTTHWFNVTYDGQNGWISAHHVTTDESCMEGDV